LPSQVLPVMVEDAGKILCQLFVVKEQTCVPVDGHAVVREVLAAQHHAFPIRHDPLGVAVLLDLDARRIEPEVLKTLQYFPGRGREEYSEDDPDRDPRPLLGENRVHDLAERVLVLPWRVKRLVLNEEFRLGTIDKLESVL